MKFVIIGSGIIGLSIAKALIEKKIHKPLNILILDKYAIPSKGTSVHNSGVLHAGLYYKPGSMKAKLSIDGGIKLREWCKKINLPILECGKLLIPFNENDYVNLEKIEKNALNNGCNVEMIDHDRASNIQPFLIKKDKYLWSPNTSVFDPKLIVERLYKSLKEMGVNFLKKSVILDDSDKKRLIFDDYTNLSYENYINCAGPGALDIAKSVTNKFDNLTILPFLGQYAVQKSGLEIKTNLYPVPDPELPFLGIHLTPRINESSLIGPNAIPVFKKDIQGYDLKDLRDIPSIITNNIILFASNKSNYRNHALSELSFNSKNKFYVNALRYFSSNLKSNFQIEMDSKTYGIRAQLLNRNTYELENDFIYEKINNNIHIVNAVSPAFTSCFSLAEFIVNKLI
ncbi:NAD(P)/FAD-dependent oxidoreductase [uncultured Prochlorococcus sp.]|uniref:NAD(P)/FAD-dependent oxidoreductase n=1 Tax=uncultured Prochlorococcus sp. TaxID=159733 RepID=UPI00258845D6|nr:FAD-dependent oxidoreductase [uncultured Prochlorococcus sp.]